LRTSDVELSNNVAENSMAPIALVQKELAARGQREVRTQGRVDSLGGGILPPDWRAGQRISAGRPAEDESKKIIGSRSAHPSPMEGLSRLTWVGQTDTVNQ
jgi:hypothetical protein